MEWERPAKTYKWATDEITKYSVGSALRIGICYDKRVDIQTMRQEGKLPAINKGLPYGRWMMRNGKPDFRFILNKGQIQVRINPGKIKTTWFKNGCEIDFDQIRDELQAGEKRGPGIVSNIPLKYIRKINSKTVRMDTKKDQARKLDPEEIF